MTTFRIAEVLSSDSELVSADLVLMSAHDFRELFDIAPQYATDITLSVRNPKEVVTIARKIAYLLPESRPIIRDEILRTYDAAGRTTKVTDFLGIASNFRYDPDGNLVELLAT